MTPRVLLPLLAILPLAGCLGRLSEREPERLRRRVAVLERELGLAHAAAAELRTKLAESERARTDALRPDLLDALPRCAGIEISPISGLVERDGVTWVVFYVRPFDGQRRFLQVVGTLVCDASHVADDAAAASLTRVELPPAQLRQAYRSTLVGTHYSIEAPLAASPRPGTILLRVELVDALSGQVHRAQRTLDVR